MSQQDVINIARNTLWVIIETSMPLLIVSMVVGLIISLFQTLTSIQEQTLTFVPKILAIFLTMMLIGHWMLNVMVNFMTSLWADFTVYIR